MIDAVNEINPDALFIGMTAPKQEKWAIRHRNEINAKCICAIGAVFDFYAGTVKRPGKIWINLGLEWLGRMITEPMRLYKRYLIYGPIFAYRLVQQKLKTQREPAEHVRTRASVSPVSSLKSA
jgi:N-acetylglucosaminyldiphosphoundecaprenol N-acetyl-beta-D-mannosaminyltransferase